MWHGQKVGCLLWKQLLVGLPGRVSVTALMHNSLHWLSCPQRVTYKLSFLTYWHTLPDYILPSAVSGRSWPRAFSTSDLAAWNTWNVCATSPIHLTRIRIWLVSALPWVPLWQFFVTSASWNVCFFLLFFKIGQHLTLLLSLLLLLCL